MARFVAWLRAPADNVIVLETGCGLRSPATVNRHLAAVFGFYEHHARSGVEVAAGLVAWRRMGRGSYKPFLHHVTAGPTDPDPPGEAAGPAAGAAHVDRRAGGDGAGRAGAGPGPVPVGAAGRDRDADRAGARAAPRRLRQPGRGGAHRSPSRQRQRRASEAALAGGDPGDRRAGPLLLGLHAQPSTAISTPTTCS